VPILLVGNKVDLRDCTETKAKRLLTWEQGYFLAKKIGAYAYLECSAKTRKGIRQVFEIAARAALLPEKTRSKLKQKGIKEKLKVLNIKSLRQPRLGKLMYTIDLPIH
jgi:Ras family protein A